MITKTNYFFFFFLWNNLGAFSTFQLKNTIHNGFPCQLLSWSNTSVICWQVCVQKKPNWFLCQLLLWSNTSVICWQVCVQKKTMDFPANCFCGQTLEPSLGQSAYLVAMGVEGDLGDLGIGSWLPGHPNHLLMTPLHQSYAAVLRPRQVYGKNNNKV